MIKVVNEGINNSEYRINEITIDIAYNGNINALGLVNEANGDFYRDISDFIKKYEAYMASDIIEVLEDLTEENIELIRRIFRVKDISNCYVLRLAMDIAHKDNLDSSFYNDLKKFLKSYKIILVSNRINIGRDLTDEYDDIDDILDTYKEEKFEMTKVVNENKVALDVKVPKLREGEKHIILTVRDSERSIEHLIEAIKNTANPGHSFPVVIDPDDSETRQEFYIDGDGTDAILDITVTDVCEGDEE